MREVHVASTLRSQISLSPHPMTALSPCSLLRHALAMHSLLFVATLATPSVAQTPASPPPASSSTYLPLGIPKPGPVTDGPYAPQPILPGGIVVPLYPPDSPRLNRDKIREAEKYNMGGSPGRIQSIVAIHNPSIEVHRVDTRSNTGAAIIVVPGGGHRTLNVGSEGSDLVSWLFNYGITTVILRNRLKADGYDLEKDAMIDALQSVRLVRAHAKEWNLDPTKIGILGFSAGAELAAWTAVFYDDYDRANAQPSDLLAGISSRPDFVGLIYPGPTPFTRDPATKIPVNVPPSFIVCAGSGDKVHAIWADTYFSSMLKAGVPNLEMHIYGNGTHGGGLTDRGGVPFGTWQNRYIDWFRDLGFLERPGGVTKAAHDVDEFAKKKP